MFDGLLEPLFLFFVVGFLGGVLRSDLKLPDSVYQLISTYLLLAIGLKGGVQLAQAQLGNLLWPVAATVFLGVLIPIVVFFVALFLGRLSRADSAALAAHYGSTSAVTFAAVLAMLNLAAVEFEGFMPVLLVIMEIPAILVAILLFRHGNSGGCVGHGAITRELVLNRSVFLLISGMAVGWIAGPDRFLPFKLLFVDAFKPILAFFILEMGLLASQQMPEIRRAGKFLLIFSVVGPIGAGAFGGWLGLLSGLSTGGAIVLATLAASASYIAAPAAIRVAIPEANTGMAVAASLTITFPFNLAVGIPLYSWWVNWLVRS